MSTKQSRRARRLLRKIEATGKTEPIHAEPVGIDWIEAAEGDTPKPKRFSMTAYNGGPMQVSAYGPPVVIDLAGITAKAPTPILRDHDQGRVIGHADQVDVGTSTLKLSGIVSGAGPDATEVVAAAGNGFPWQASVGARPDKLEFVGEGVNTKVNGKTFTGPLYVARKSTLGEVSFVALGADRKTRAKVAASAARDFRTKENDMEFEQWIEALGLDMAELRDDQTAKLRAKYDAELKAAEKAAKIEGQGGGGGKPPAVQAPTFDLQAIGLCYAKHEAGIETKAIEYTGRIEAGKLSEIRAKALKAALDNKAKAITEQWAEPRLDAEYIKAQALYEVELMRAERPKAPAIHASTRDVSAPVIEAAFARSCGLEAERIERHYRPEAIEAADRQFRNFGLQELLLLAAGVNGYVGRQRIGNDNLREVMRYAFPVQATGWSEIDVSGILSNTANKILLAGFEAAPQTWREVAATRSVSDFKSVTAYRLTSDLEYEEVGPTGEIKHGSLGEESYSMQAKTYAKMLTLTRVDIINDDLNAFDDIRRRLGIGSVLKMQKVFWTGYLSDSSFYTTARENLQEGTSAPDTQFGDDGMANALKIFRQLKDADGNLLGLTPDRVIVPPELEATAQKYYVATELRNTTASTKYPTANIYQGRFRPVVVPELSDSGYTGYSATAWYLLANPAMLATAVMCFLNGQQSPTVESADADFNQLGIQMRGYHDFGFAFAEWRAGVKNTGVAAAE